MSSTLRKLDSGPEQTDDSLPALITLALPLTGAQMKSAPRSFSLLRISTDSSTAMVEQSTNTPGVLLPDSTPSLPKYTCSTSLPSATIENTTSMPERSESLSTTLPPILASGSALERVRFQIETS